MLHLYEHHLLRMADLRREADSERLAAEARGAEGTVGVGSGGRRPGQGTGGGDTGSDREPEWVRAV
ncbi:hypothetical protein SCA03_61580 [Streptomyces cacaoi]|uniref:Uncharacterized protein n=2 Tax=Streptomyces TaxID=1883 RepID=A0A4Y3RA81_STRCI|nr:hypothetical protein SCA03_61580 [Streptomyces cacaoi]